LGSQSKKGDFIIEVEDKNFDFGAQIDVCILCNVYVLFLYKSNKKVIVYDI